MVSALYDELQYDDGPVQGYWEHTAGGPGLAVRSLGGDASFDVAVTSITGLPMRSLTCSGIPAIVQFSEVQDRFEA